MKTEYETYRRIISIEGYIQCIQSVLADWTLGDQKSDVLFRGQSDDYELLPGIYRRVSSKVYNERSICKYFSALYKNYTNERFGSESEMFAFMQHYGFPTRLLDWTENSLLALYFAIDRVRLIDDVSPVVWILNSGALNSVTHRDLGGITAFDSPFIMARFKMIEHFDGKNIDQRFFDENNEFKAYQHYMEFPLAFFPASSGNPRLAIQKGVFTIHGTEKTSIEKVFTENERQSQLLKVEISKQSIPKIRQDLRYLGVTPRSVYPDLEGLQQEVRDLSLYEKSET
jgi:hypothetical protein